jgi:hypothetical protein
MRHHHHLCVPPRHKNTPMLALSLNAHARSCCVFVPRSYSMPTRARAVSSCLDRCCRVIVIGSGPPGPSLGPNGGPCVPPEPCHTNRSYFGQADLSRKLKVNDSPLHHRCSLCCFWWVGEWTCMWVVHASQWIFTHSSLCTCNHGCANKVLVKWRMVWCEREHLCSIHNYNS